MLLENHTRTSLKKHYPKLILVLLVVIFISLHYGKIEHPVNPNYGAIKEQYLKSCTLTKFPEDRGPLKQWMLCGSERVFGNINVVPFLFSVGLIPMTYLLARKITNSEIRSLVAASLLLGSPIIAYLGTSAALTSDWAFFLISSMYFVYRKPEIALLFFIASLSAKGLPLLILPAMIYFIWQTKLPSRNITVLLFVDIGIIMCIIPFLGVTSIIQDNGFAYHPEEFDHAVKDLWFVFRSDKLQFIILPLSAFIIYKSKNQMAKPLLVLMGMFYSMVFLLPIFSIYQMFDYRMIPLVVWGAIGITFYTPKKVKWFKFKRK